MESLLWIFAAGLAGAICKDIVKDNSIELPIKNDGKLVLGSLGGMIIGGVAAICVDGSLLTAFMAGFTGIAIIEGLIEKKTENTTDNDVWVAGIIRYIARQESVDPELAVRVAKCESALKPTAKNVNADGSIDRGIYQINNKWHPEVSDEDAFDIIKSTRFFCKAMKEGHLDWWNASKKCWDLTKK